MIMGIGTDIVTVDRLRSWHHFSYEQLNRIFSNEELAYCANHDGYDWSMLAARFAAKEAFFKALSSVLIKRNLTSQEFSLLFLCKHVCVTKGTWNISLLKVDWRGIEEKIGASLPEMHTELSLSHEQAYALAVVILIL